MGSYRMFGPLGLIVLVFGVIAGFITGDWTSLYVLVHVILGSMMLALYLFTQVDSLKESVGSRKAKHGTNSIVYTVVTLAVVAVVNYLAVQHPTRYDVTEQSMFSLAPQSAQLAGNLDSPVEARAFFREGEDPAVRDLLASYAAESDLFTYEIIDPDKRPELAERYEITAHNTLHLTVGEESSRINDVSEESLTNTLIRLTAAAREVAYFVSGHAEPDPDDASTPNGWGLAKAALANEGYDMESLVLGSVPDVPADCGLLVVAGPKRPFFDLELELIERYIDRGGKALLLLDPQAGDQLVPLLARRGVTVGNDVVVEQRLQLFAGATLGVDPVVGSYGPHAITAGFSEYTNFRMVRTVSKANDESAADGVSVTELAMTSDASWAESDVARLLDTGEVEQTDDDRAGPVSLGVAMTLTGNALNWTAPRIASASDGAEGGGEASDSAPADLEGRVVVFGDSDWITNGLLGRYFNEDLLLNAVGWLGGEEELISIRPRNTRASRVMLTQGQSTAVFYTTVLLLPELILFSGMMLWLRRGRR